MEFEGEGSRSDPPSVTKNRSERSEFTENHVRNGVRDIENESMDGLEGENPKIRRSPFVNFKR